MPATHSILFAAKPSLMDFKIGIPPATDASKARITLFFLAKANNSFPKLASNALLAVTTCFLFSIALITKSFAIVVPPISSTMTSIFLSETNLKASSVTSIELPTVSFARAMSFSATATIFISVNVLRCISLRFDFKSSNTPPPTVPIPNKPIFILFIDYDFLVRSIFFKVFKIICNALN